MKIDLLKIEEKLKEFFEKDLQIIANKNPLQAISDEMILTLERNLKQIGEKTYAPNIFRISIKDKNLICENDLNEWKRSFQQIIKDTLQDNNFQLAGPLHIQYFFNPKTENDFQISVSNSSIPSGKTTSIFTDEKSESKSAPLLDGYLITPDEKLFQIKKPIINIGRREDNDLVLDNLRVSRVHAQIRQINDKHVIFDLDSLIGIKVNGIKLHQHPLNPGDVIEIADVPIIYGSDRGNIFVGIEESKTKLLNLKKEINKK